MVAQQDICFLHLAGNPICYTATNKSFRHFIERLFPQIFKSTQQGAIYACSSSSPARVQSLSLSAQIWFKSNEI